MTDNSSIDLSLTNIYRSWRAFRAGKKTSRAILEYETDLEDNLIILCLALNNDSYEHGGYDHKILSDKKRRDIAVATVQDRIVHRLLYDHLVQKLDKRFDPDVWSGRKDKGLHAALKRIAYLVDKYSDCYVWRADIEKFFDSVDHRILKNCLEHYMTDETVQKLLDKVIGSYTHNEKSVSQSVSQSVSHGIPIGNLTSQILANVYLNEFDRFVRHQLKPLAFVRYGDDFLLFAHTWAEVQNFQRSGKEWLTEYLCLNLHSKNNVIIQPKQGVHVLGHWIYPKHQVVVDTMMARKMLSKLNTSNVATYKSMQIPKRKQNLMSHLLTKNIRTKKKS